MTEQEAFDRWYRQVCPIGDADSVKRQWEMSEEYAEYLDEKDRSK